MPDETARRSLWQRWDIWGFLIVLMVPLALLDTAHRVIGSSAMGEPVPWERVLARDLAIWLTYLPFVGPVLFFANRFRLDERRSLAQNALLHFVASMTFAYLHLAAVGFLTSQTGLGRESVRTFGPVAASSVMFLPEFFHYMRTNFTLDFLAYWAIVGIFFAAHYYVQSRERAIAAARLEASLTTARLDALRSQLNPHFLFNTLNTISVLAMKGERDAVIGMLARLSDLLRISLDDSRPQEIPLAKELEFLDGYLEIQSIRFADRLTISRDVSHDTLRAVVPAMILQPIVENAIKHGIGAQCGPAHIAILAARENGMLRLRVSDCGPGFQPTSERSHGIGLANTEARLRQIYGPAQRIEYGRVIDGGASVTISIPFRTVEAGNSRLSAEELSA
jgi:two-component system LytT family sensor kinase